MKILFALALLVLLLTLADAQNRKKFGGTGGSSGGTGSNPKANPDYEPPPEEYDQDALYYEDYDEQGAKKEKDKDAKEGTTAEAAKEKPVKPAPKPIAPARPPPKETHVEEKNNGGSPSSLFAPRRNRTPFQPRPADKPKPTLPSFIRHPVNPAQITTPTPRPPNSNSAGPIERSPVVIPKASSVIRATTAKPSRFKTGNTRDRTTAAPAESENSNGRKYGGPSRGGGSRPARAGFRTGTA